MTENRTEREKMLAGEPYLSPDPELMGLIGEARSKLKAFNNTPREDAEARIAALKALFGRCGNSWVESPFTVDYGIHVEMGDFCFVNVNCMFLDSNRIVIGNRVAFGPAVQLITAAHPVRAEERTTMVDDLRFPFRAVGYALPIEIGDDCWIGAGAIVLPGVTIGSGTTIGAGSVVTKSIPARSVAVGSPCRVVRVLD